MPRWSSTTRVVSLSSRSAPSHRRRKRPRVRIIRWLKSISVFYKVKIKGKSTTGSDWRDVGVVLGAELRRRHGHCHYGAKRSSNELWPDFNGQIGAKAVFLGLRKSPSTPLIALYLSPLHTAASYFRDNIYIRNKHNRKKFSNPSFFWNSWQSESMKQQQKWAWSVCWSVFSN